MGGGCRNELLCHLTANACGLEVSAGPDEGTALDSLLIQARSLGVVDVSGMTAMAAATTAMATVCYRRTQQLTRRLAV